MSKIAPCLWFDHQAEEAVNLYVSLFDDARITAEQRFPEGAPGRTGEIMMIGFEIAGQEFMALNDGTQPFTQAHSFLVHCQDQAEVDRLWKVLTEGGEEQPCGWLIDRFGVSWQIVPDRLMELLGDRDPERAQRAMQAMLQMKKIEIAALEAAADGAA
jgi:predicted 3-demethylubiquinone-9 3-methyltransferase (glyoxalase superfamily)